MKNLRSSAFFEKFKETLRKSEAGEIQLNLSRTNEIEQQISDQGLLRKFRPPKYESKLRNIVSQINDQFESGFEIDKEAYN